MSSFFSITIIFAAVYQATDIITDLQCPVDTVRAVRHYINDATEAITTWTTGRNTADELRGVVHRNSSCIFVKSNLGQFRGLREVIGHSGIGLAGDGCCRVGGGSLYL